MTKFFGSAAALALYLGIGSLFHAFFAGDKFHWESAWTWGLLLGWPVVTTAFFTVLGLGIMVVVLVAVLIVMAWESWRDRGKSSTWDSIVEGYTRARYSDEDGNYRPRTAPTPGDPPKPRKK